MERRIVGDFATIFFTLLLLRMHTKLPVVLLVLVLLVGLYLAMRSPKSEKFTYTEVSSSESSSESSSRIPKRMCQGKCPQETRDAEAKFFNAPEPGLDGKVIDRYSGTLPGEKKLIFPARSDYVDAWWVENRGIIGETLFSGYPPATSVI